MNDPKLHDTDRDDLEDEKCRLRLITSFSGGMNHSQRAKMVAHRALLPVNGGAA